MVLDTDELLHLPLPKVTAKILVVVVTATGLLSTCIGGSSRGRVLIGSLSSWEIEIRICKNSLASVWN